MECLHFEGLDTCNVKAVVIRYHLFLSNPHCWTRVTHLKLIPKLMPIKAEKVIFPGKTDEGLPGRMMLLSIVPSRETEHTRVGNK